MIYQGDCKEVLQSLPAGIVQTCVTSPPYYGLRDYGHEGQIGLEPTPEAYVSRLVDVFREVWRVLKDDGTDLASSWTEGRAVWNKGSAGVLEQTQKVEQGLPFAILGLISTMAQ